MLFFALRIHVPFKCWVQLLNGSAEVIRRVGTASKNILMKFALAFDKVDHSFKLLIRRPGRFTGSPARFPK